MAGSKKPDESGPTTLDASDEKERTGSSDKPRASLGRIPSLVPLAPASAAQASPSAPTTATNTSTLVGQPVFRPNVTAFWVPPRNNQPHHSGFIRIATPVAPRPDGIVSPISARPAPSPGKVAAVSPAPDGTPAARPGTVSISAGTPSAYVETPPFGFPSIPGGGGVGTGQSPAAIPSRLGEVSSGRIPFRVGGYEVATRLAQGGVGSIYICRHADNPQKLFALKVVRQHAVQKEAAIAAFRREAEVGKLVSHVNAQTVIDEGNYDGQPFLILPYIEGGTLGALLADDARPPVANVVTVLLDVLRALEHVHRVVDHKENRVGLVHADISPENILVGTDGVALVTDFGSARFASDVTEDGKHSVTMGKPSYMSPERLRGEQLDARSDIFSVGVVMWNALTGQKLFAAESYDQTVMRVMRRKIPAPSSLGAPRALDEVCLEALSRSREGRFASADEMADALMTAAVKADLVATRERVGSWVRREMGETLAERRRRIEQMFGDHVRTPVSVAHREPRPRPATTPRNGVSPNPTIRMSAADINAFGAAKRADVARTVFMPEVASSASKITRKQWYVVTSISVIAFFLTLAIGSWLSRSTGSRRSARPTPAATASTGSTAVPAAEIPSTSASASADPAVPLLALPNR